MNTSLNRRNHRSKLVAGIVASLRAGEPPKPEKPAVYMPKVLDMVHVKPCLLFPRGDDVQVLAYDYADDTGGFKSLVFICYSLDGCIVRIRPDEISGPAERHIVPFLVRSLNR